MVKINTFILCIIAPFLFSFGTITNSKIIYDYSFCDKGNMPYVYGSTLKFDDFNFQNNRPDRVLGRSYTGIMYSVVNNKNNISVGVCAYFDKRSSFLVRGNKIESVLNHEQKHFDISYLFSLKFIYKLKSYGNLTESLVDSIYNEIDKELDVYQKNYDIDTDHSMDRNKQKEWDNLISNEIRILKNNLNL